MGDVLIFKGRRAHNRALVPVEPQPRSRTQTVLSIIVVVLVVGAIVGLGAIGIGAVALFSFGCAVSVQWFFDHNMGWVPCLLFAGFLIAVFHQSRRRDEPATAIGMVFPIRNKFIPHVAYTRDDGPPDDHRPAA